MPYVITASKLARMRSEKAPSASVAFDMATDFTLAGFTLISIVDEHFRRVTLLDLEAAAGDEKLADGGD